MRFAYSAPCHCPALPLALVPVDPPVKAADDEAVTERGWHLSSWDLQRGLTVVELGGDDVASAWSR